MAEGDVRHVKINDVVEQKLIPPLSRPKRPPTEAQIRAAKAMAEAHKIRKGILKQDVKTTEVVAVKAEVMEEQEDSTEDSTASSQGPILVKKEVKEETAPRYYPPSSPEGPTFYRGKPAELTMRRYPV